MTIEQAITDFELHGMCDCGEYAYGVLCYYDSEENMHYSPSCHACNEPILDGRWIELDY